MSDEGDKTCPLCAEEMDMTDQQLKPCKCGYEICVWCWHHIMDMAEKDETEGRCPACRTPYNKEKIVGTASSCERLVSDMNVEKKKSQKGKSRTSEGRKQLATVRVIQRNLVYVVGLPLNLADEDLLLRREYFGQYGKVLKVSISRTAAGAIQHSANSTCSVYITYSKEEEAVRCIQSVHGFVLDGRSLRACFGTTKYCHAWLRNVACSNPDCLYLHEIGSQEDSFTKDEIISAYTRSRVQQIIGSSNSMQRRSGNVLPPPTDEYCNNAASLGKPITKSSANTNNLATIARVSPPNSSSGRSTALPAGASWVARTSNNQPLLGSIQCSNGPLKPKLDAFKGPVACSTASGSPSQLSLHNDTRKMLVPNEESSIFQDKNKIETLEPAKKDIDTDGRITDFEYSVTSLHSATLPISGQPDGLPSTKLPPNSINLVDSLTTASGLTTDKDLVDAINKNVDNACSDILSVSIYEKQILENGNVQHIRKPGTCQTSGTTVNTSKGAGFAVLQPDFRLGMKTQVTQVTPRETEDDLLSFDKQRLKDPEIATIRTRDFSCAPHLSKNSNEHSSQFSNADNSISVDLDRQAMDRNRKLIVSTSKFPETSGFPSGCAASVLRSPEVKDVEYSNLFKKRSLLGRHEGEISGGAFDIGESSIISNILSMDFDTWDETLTSPQNLAKLIGETDKLRGGFEGPGSLKIQSCNRSRFSFAREEEPMNQASDFGQLIDRFEKGFMQHSLDSDFSIRSGLQIEKVIDHNGFPGINATESDKFAGSRSDIPSSGLSVPRSQISAPPGFSVANRAPPPGFTSHERANQNFDTVSGNHMLDFSSLLRNNYQGPSGGNNTISNGDIEFMDPAILAVGKETLPGGINSPGADLWSSYSTQLSMYEEARFQSLLQRSLPPHQNERFSDLGDGYSGLGDAYGIPSLALEQKLVNNLSSFSQFSLPQSRNGLTSNGQWDGWNEIRSGNNLGMAELPGNDRLGFNRFYGGYEDSKI